MKGYRYRDLITIGMKQSRESKIDFPWFMLVSAFLSCGAKGIYYLNEDLAQTNKNNGEIGKVKHSNLLYSTSSYWLNICIRSSCFY